MAKKKSSSQHVPAPRRRRKKLEDNPRIRYQRLSADRTMGAQKGVSLAKMRVDAVEDTTDMYPAQETPTTPATSGGNNWVPLGPMAIPNGQTYGGARVVVTGRVTAIAIDPTNPNIIYAAAARGGIWKTTDGGITWSPRSDNEGSLAIGALALAPSNPQVLYAGTGEGNIYFYATTAPLNSINESYAGSGILKSSTGGSAWATQGAGTFVGACFYRIAVHPTNADIAFAASSLGLYRTTDGGINWIKMTGLPAISASVIAATDVMFDPSSPATAYVAFWGNGIYKTNNSGVATPSWSKLAGGFPATNLSRISTAVSATAPLRLYALVADASDTLNGFYASADGGSNWSIVAAASGVVELFGAYTGNVAVDIATPDVVYISGVSLYKAVNTAGTWAVSAVGTNIHPDNHAFAPHPTNHLMVYAGTDGGAYKSSDGGTTWDDTFNEGLTITQFEFVDQHPSSDAVIIGGTQDNGTEQFRNSPAFYHSADGDGGAAGVDQVTPANMLHTYYGASPERSTQGGALTSWTPVGGGLAGNSLFYPPVVFDQTNSQNLAFGMDRIYLDAAQGTGSWPVNVVLPGISGDVSVISYVNSNLIYACSTSGQVYRLAKSGAAWSANAIHSAPLPTNRWIWGVSTLPGDVNTIVVVFAGFGVRHVWRGAVPVSGTTAIWTDISGTGANHVPDIPVNALAIDSVSANAFYVGTDIGVFRTVDAGVNWQQFSDGLPNVAVYDLLIHAPTRLLRAATHGRGIWERKLDVPSMPATDIYVRDHLLATGRIVPTPASVANFDDPLQQVALGDALQWWMCADAKVDSPSATMHTYQMPVSAVDYLAFETKLAHTNAQRGVTNRIYVQIHNRGIQAATGVTVKVLYAAAAPYLPDLPSDFWTAFPGTGTTTDWKPIGAAQTIASVSPTRPEILEWDWTPPVTEPEHTCLLIVSDCASDPIPAANKIFDVGELVANEKRVGLKNLHLIDALPAPHWISLNIAGLIRAGDVLRISGLPAGWSAGLLLPSAIGPKLKQGGLTKAALTKSQIAALQTTLGAGAKLYNPAQFQTVSVQGGSLTGFYPGAKNFNVMLLFSAKAKASRGAVTIVAESGKKIVGGNTFVLRP